MGDGYMYHCEKCGKSYSVFPGMGMLYPQVCEDVLSAVRAGEYGQKLKEAAESERYVGVAAENKVYRCECCGNWEVLPDASVFGLADKEKGQKIRFGGKTIAEWGEIPYVDGKKDYRLIEEYVPTCEKCGGDMHAKKLTKRLRLACHDCGTPLTQDPDAICWD